MYLQYELRPATTHTTFYAENKLKREVGLAGQLVRDVRRYKSSLIIPEGVSWGGVRQFSVAVGGDKGEAIRVLFELARCDPSYRHLIVQDLWARPPGDVIVPGSASHFEVDGIHYFKADLSSLNLESFSSIFDACASPRVVGAFCRKGGADVVPVPDNISVYFTTVYAGEGFLVFALP